jgi:hypothetical protein
MEELNAFVVYTRLDVEVLFANEQKHESSYDKSVLQNPLFIMSQ